jgi:hypothetical protein
MHPKMAFDGALPSYLLVYETVSSLTSRRLDLGKKGLQENVGFSQVFDGAQTEQRPGQECITECGSTRVTRLGFSISGCGQRFSSIDDNVRLFERHVNNGIALKIENIVHIHSFGDGHERDIPALLFEQLVQSVGTVFE